MKMFSGVRVDAFKKIHDGIIKFNDLKKELKIESNELSYHLNILKKHEYIETKNSSYYLTKKGKTLYPDLPIITHEHLPVNVIVSVAIIDGDKIFFQKKPREPEKGTLIFFGGLAEQELPIEDSAKRQAEKQFQGKIQKLKLRCINEFIKEGNHWVVYFFTADLDVKGVGIPLTYNDAKKKKLYGENSLFLDMIKNRTVKVMRTQF